MLSYTSHCYLFFSDFQRPFCEYAEPEADNGVRGIPGLCEHALPSDQVSDRGQVRQRHSGRWRNYALHRCRKVKSKYYTNYIRNLNNFCWSPAAVRMRDILIRIRILGSVPYSGLRNRILLFLAVTFKTPTKKILLFFCLFLSVGTLTSVFLYVGTLTFKDSLSLRSHKTVKIMVYLICSGNGS